MKDTKLARIGALGGAIFVALQLVGQGMIQVGGSEPPFDARADTILAFFEGRDPALFPIGGYLSALSIVPFLWFLGRLWVELRYAEGQPAWMANVAFGSGMLSSAAWLIGGWELAMFRIGQGLSPEMGRLLFDQGNLAFAGTWIFFANMLLSAGIITLRSSTWPRWFAWLSIALAVGLFAARAAWTTSAAFAPYVGFWAWLIACSVLLIRRPSPLDREKKSPGL